MGKSQAIRIAATHVTPFLEGDGVAQDTASIRLDISKCRDVARAWAETIPVEHRRNCAALLAMRGLKALADRIVPSTRHVAFPELSSDALDGPGERLAVSIGSAVARLPVDEALHFITSLYPILLPTSIRSDLGAFYTPPVLVNRLLDSAEEEGLDWRTARILDPAAGGGAFLFQAIRRMMAAQPECEPAFFLARIGNRITGFELDPRAAGLAQTAVEILLSDLADKADKPIPKIVKTCDTLGVNPEPIFDLVTGNPPYGRVSLAPERRRQYARGLYGHANLYGLFTDAALRWAKPGGIVAYLTPTSFLGGQYFAALRGLLAKEAPPVAIDFVHARRGVFEDVLQETLLAIYRRGGEPVRAQIHYLTVVTESEARIVRNGTIGLPADPAAPWLAPRMPEHSRLIARADNMASRLSDWGYSVSTGPLVWNRFKGQLMDRPEGRGVHPLIWAEAVTADGRFVHRAQKKNHAPYFRLGPGDAWLLVEETCVLVQRTTAKEQTRRLIAAELPADFVAAHDGVVVENHLNMIRANQQPKVPPAVVAALLNSRVADELFRCMSGSVAVSAFELEALPLPSPTEAKELMRLVSDGASRTAVEAECNRLYGQESR